MNSLSKKYLVVFAFISVIFTSFSSVAEEAPIAKPVVVVRAFDVHGDAEGFLKLLDKAITTARGIIPKESGVAKVLAGNVGGQSAHLITVSTTYASLEDYSKAQKVLYETPELKAIRVEMDNSNYKVTHSSVNTLIAVYN